MKNKKIYVVLAICTIFFFSLNVNADITSSFICVDGAKVQVDYDNSYVNVKDINTVVLNSGFVQGHDGDTNYKVKGISTGQSCYLSNGSKVSSCPSSGISSNFNLNGKYSIDNMIASGLVSVYFDLNIGLYRVTIDREIANKFDVRVSPSLSTNGDSQSLNEKNYSKNFYPYSQFLKQKSNGNYEFTMKIGSVAVIEYYEKSSNDCNGAFIASQTYQMRTYEHTLVANPAVYDKNSGYYKQCHDRMIENSGLPNDEDSELFKRNEANLCYDEIILLDDYLNLSSNLPKQIDTVVRELSGIKTNTDNDVSEDNLVDYTTATCSSGNGETYCEGDGTNSNNSKHKGTDGKVEVYRNGDWGVYCSYDFNFRGATPQLTLAGSGIKVGADINYNLTRDCEIRFIGSPAYLKPKCQPVFATVQNCSAGAVGLKLVSNTSSGQTITTPSPCGVVSHYRYAGIDITGHGEGGPNEDFDECVYSCDGGKYGQSCINKCYDYVYNNNSFEKQSDLFLKKTSFSNLSKDERNSFFGFDFNNDYKAEKMATSGKIDDVKYTIHDPEIVVNDDGSVDVKIHVDLEQKIETHDATLSNGGKVKGLCDGCKIKEIGRGITELGYKGIEYIIEDQYGRQMMDKSAVFSDACAGSSAYIESICPETTTIPGTYTYHYENVASEPVCTSTQVFTGQYTPNPCSHDPEGEYQQMLDRIKSNWYDANNKIRASLSAGNIEMTLVDTYLQNNDGSYYVFKINNTDSNIKLDQYGSIPDPVYSSNNSDSIGQRGETLPRSTSLFKINVTGINIDSIAYVGKKYGNVVYKNDTAFSLTKANGVYAQRKFNGFEISDYYNGGKLYYTSLYSNDKNVRVNENGNIVLTKDCYNIETKVTEVGDIFKKFGTTNSCYYGVYNNFKDKNSSDGGPGITYIFRPISLDDVFPDEIDRKPRWNWTNAASLNLDGNDPYLKYNVNPVKTTEEIENREYKIYNDNENEIDYEIIVDRTNLARIKSFNREQRGYTNFALNCNQNVNGATFCKSNFLDNATLIKNAGQVRVKAQIGTNND